MLISIVTAVFNQTKENIGELHARISKVCSDNGYNYEILFVDDGSRNNIFEFLKALHDLDRKAKIVVLDKNYGQANAFFAGLYFAKGDIVATIDADLQYLPEELPCFIEKANKGYDAIGGKRKLGERKLGSKILSLYYRVFLGFDMQDHACTYAALSREVVNNILNVSNPMLMRHLAYTYAKRKAEIGVSYNKRKYGRSGYNKFKYIFYGIKQLGAFSRFFGRPKGLPFKVAQLILD